MSWEANVWAIKQRMKLPLDGDAEKLVPVEKRRFGPAFEKPCRNRHAIICDNPECRAGYECQYRIPAPPAYGTIWYEHL